MDFKITALMLTILLTLLFKNQACSKLNLKMNVTDLNSHLVITSIDNVVIFDRNFEDTAAVKIPPPNLPPNLTKGQLEVLNKEQRTINTVIVSSNNNIAVSTENKQVVVFTPTLSVTKNFIINRTASKILFTKDEDILVADRTGDVYLYKFSDKKTEPVLLLGHLSMILDMALSECEKFIVTCDRDEKIRVSHYPNTYNIVSYCLGHEEFVNCVKIVKNLLVSASGDGTVRLWNYTKGQELTKINTNQFISDKNLLEQFSAEMDLEKVDVTALPITDMQTVSSNNLLTIAVSLHNYNAIQIYKVDINSYNWTFFKTIENLNLPFKFHLSNNLTIFDNSKMQTYNNNDFSVINNNFENFYYKYKEILKIVDNSIAVLYKRKFDNVQEYLERKKMRLENK